MWRYYFQINWLFLIGLKVLLSRCDLEIYLQRNSHSRCHRSCCYIMCKHGAALPIVVLFSGTTKIYVVSMVALWLCYVQCHGNIYCLTTKKESYDKYFLISIIEIQINVFFQFWWLQCFLLSLRLPLMQLKLPHKTIPPPPLATPTSLPTPPNSAILYLTVPPMKHVSSWFTCWLCYC